jgi:hypothetical protein
MNNQPALWHNGIKSHHKRVRSSKWAESRLASSVGNSVLHSTSFKTRPVPDAYVL